MKRLILVLLLLGFVVPASADIFVYNYKEVGTGWDTWGASDWGLGNCEQYKYTDTGFLVVETTGSDTANIRYIYTWKDRNGKHAEIETDAFGDGLGSTLAQISVKKTIQIISFGSSGERVLYAGQIKNKKIGNTTYTLATSLTGSWTWDDDTDIGTAKITMTLNAKFSAWIQAQGFSDVASATSGFLSYLETDQGYNP